MAIETISNLVLARGGYDMQSADQRPAFVLRADTSGVSHPEQWLVNLLGGQKTASGKYVTPGGAQENLATAFGCIRILATTKASLPLHVHRYRPDGGSDIAAKHWAYSVLHDAWNDEMSSYTARMYMAQNEAAWGNGYALIEWDGAGKLKALWPLRPDWMTVYRDPNGRKWYYYQPASGPREGLYRPDEIIHVRGIGNDLVGFSPIRAAAQNIGNLMTAEEYSGSIFANGARIGGILQIGGKLDPRQRGTVESDFDEKYAGAAKANKTLVIDSNSKFTPNTLPPADAQYLEMRSFESGVISTKIYGVPPHVTGDTEKQTSWGTGVEQMTLGFYKFTIGPQLECFEDEVNLKILGGEYYAKHNVNALMRGDFAGRVTGLATLVEKGIFTANEARAYEDKNPLPGGDELRAQSQNVPLAQQPQK